VAVFLSYASPAGHALIDRELYLPRSWTADPARCAAAGIPGKTVFATKPGLARRRRRQGPPVLRQGLAGDRPRPP
jgi:SRSO17 transposase